jgi:hypothetical protein
LDIDDAKPFNLTRLAQVLEAARVFRGSGRSAGRSGSDRLERWIEAAFAALRLPYGGAAEVKPKSTGDVGIGQFVFALGGLDRFATCVTRRAGAIAHIHLVWNLGRKVTVIEFAPDNVPEVRAVHVAELTAPPRLTSGEGGR